MNNTNDPTYDAALGCMLGACVGDAAGATLEFIGRVPTRDEVIKALTMSGGGVFRLAPGQITDDGELTLSLAKGLSISRSFSIENIARSYAEWIRSRPFDIGGTTYSSLGCINDSDWATVCQNEGYAAAMTHAARSACMDSKANGSLMRATPLGIWGHKLKVNEIARISREDSSLSHPNQSCVYAVTCYAIAIASLINNPGDRKLAFSVANEWADFNANEEVCGWLASASCNFDVPYYPLAGFIKIAFIHAFRHLLLGSDYINAMTETLKGGGDTDTNACIVGGLIGAASGADSIPSSMRNAVLTCDTVKGRKPRPVELQASQIPALVKKLLDNAPDRL